MRKIISTLIRPKLEYAEVIWSPHMKKHVLKLERIQRIATKMVPELEDITYEERLKEMHLTTLKERRERLYLYLYLKNIQVLGFRGLGLQYSRLYLDPTLD